MDIDEAAPARPKPRKKTIPKAVRVAVWNTYIGEEVGRAKCLVCKTVDISQMRFHCAHVVAEAAGGAASVDNLRPTCATCNTSMGTRNLLEFEQTHFRHL